MAKRKLIKPIIDYRLPLPENSSLCGTINTLESDPILQKQILHLAIQAAYSISDYDVKERSVDWNGRVDIKAKVASDKINLVMSLMQSLQPTNAVEAALAAQFTAMHIRGMEDLTNNNERTALQLLAFSQQTLDSFNKYRNKGMQQINVQYNVNKGQVVNIRTEEAVSNERP